MIRVYTASLNTHYGTDFSFLLDDPKKPKYTSEGAKRQLRRQLGVKRKGGVDYWVDDPDREAYFDFYGYIDTELPPSLRIKM